MGKKSMLRAAFSIFVFIATIIAINMFRYIGDTDYKPSGTFILFSVILGVILYLIVFAFTVIKLNSPQKKIKNLNKQLGFIDEFYEKAIAVINDVPDINRRALSTEVLANIYHENGDNDKAIDIIKTTVNLGELSELMRGGLCNDMMYYYLMKGDLKSADEIYAWMKNDLDELCKLTSGKAFYDTMAVREYMHGNFDASLKLLEKSRGNKKINEANDLHRAWNYIHIGREQEALDIVKRLASEAKNVYIRNQAIGLLNDMQNNK